jgi:hypothetical protein
VLATAELVASTCPAVHASVAAVPAEEAAVGVDSGSDDELPADALVCETGALDHRNTPQPTVCLEGLDEGALA